MTVWYLVMWLTAANGGLAVSTLPVEFTTLAACKESQKTWDELNIITANRYSQCVNVKKGSL